MRKSVVNENIEVEKYKMEENIIEAYHFIRYKT
jgi:hypothetical protein